MAAAAQAKLDRQSKKAADTTGACVVCYEVLVDPDQLPCGHSYCKECVVQLREKRMSLSCPLCRAPLPPGAEQLFDMGYRVWARLDRVVGKPLDLRDGTWHELSSEQQGEMDGAIVLFEEAMAQVGDGWV